MTPNVSSLVSVETTREFYDGDSPDWRILASPSNRWVTESASGRLGRAGVSW